MRVMPIHSIVVVLSHQVQQYGQTPFENLQMDLRYWVRHKMHRLGIWMNVNMYLFMWMYVKSFIKHIFVFL
jgi:hypothetical protein